MKLIYKNKKIEQLCTNESKAIKQFGDEVARRLTAAINLLESSLNLKDILAFPQYNLHKLKGNLNGMYSMYLGKKTGYRLLLIPLDENEKPIISENMSVYTLAVCVEIEEVSKHYE